ncbi:ABC-2 transporter permease [Facklamia miroungae]|uniref:ABC-2 family transporter protein n=1 Tax=Facklamia miroungae TaxID=120956 RepID=A0A1G7QIY6_9LACT|nr:ABC-2 transporter permease [Facklamia miroungae]NKZ28958.1 hypothetical protein [Facklamia miroungae]SDF98472.1 ABC-2 family transporter protein [Facklamia miroungae]
MKAILHKEFMMNYKRDKFLFISLILLGMFLSNSVQIPIILPIYFTMIYPVFTTIKEDFKKNGALINSLPIRPRKIILAKYLYTILMASVFFITVILINYYHPYFKANTLSEILISVVSSLGIVSLCYMLYYSFGKKVIELYQYFMISLIINNIMAAAEEDYGTLFGGFSKFANQFSADNLIKPLGLFLVIALIVAYIIAIRFYGKKDF